MSSFWQENKGTIMSGLSTAGKYGYQGTKFVAKTGYKAGKQQYNNSKARREGRTVNDQEDRDSLAGEPITLPPLPDVTSLPPPPLKPGQRQYTSAGEVIEGTPTPPSSNGTQGSRNQSQQSLQQQVSATPSTQVETRSVPVPSLPLRTNTASQFPTRYQPSAPVPPQTQFNPVPIEHPPAQIIQAYVRPAAALPPEAQAQPQPYSPVQIEAPVATSMADAPANTAQLEAQLSTRSSTPSFEVKPYEWKDPEERKNIKRIEIPEIDTSALPPPPVHRHRSESPKIEKPSSRASSKPPSRVSTSDFSSVSSPLASGKDGSTNTKRPELTVRTGSPNDSSSAKYENVEPVAEYEVEEQEDKGIAGAYDNVAKVSFPPPPRPCGSLSASAETLPSRNINTPTGSSSRTTSAPTLPDRTNAAPHTLYSSKTATLPSVTPDTRFNQKKKNKEEDQPPAAVLGAYNYDVKVNFQPPPKPHKKIEEVKLATTKHTPSFPRQNLSFTSSPAQSSHATPLRAPTQSSIPSTAPPAYSEPVEAQTTHTSGPLSLNDLQKVAPCPLPRSQNIHDTAIKSKEPPVVKPKPRSLHAPEIKPKPQNLSFPCTKSPAPTVKPKPKRLQTTDYEGDVFNHTQHTVNRDNAVVKTGISDITKELESVRFVAERSKATVTGDVSNKETSEASVKGSLLKSKSSSPPPIPQKKFTLQDLDKKLGVTNTGEETKKEEEGDSNSDNPFTKYLKKVVPTEDDRFQKWK